MTVDELQSHPISDFAFEEVHTVSQNNKKSRAV